MPTIRPGKPTYNVEDRGEAIYDGYRNDADELCSRFGLAEFADVATGKPGDGLFWWDKENKVLAVSGGKCFDVRQDGSFTELTGGDWHEDTPTTFAEGQKVDNSAFLYGCNGGKLSYSTGGNFTQVSSPAPEHCTHVVYNGLRFFANEVDYSRFYFTDILPASSEFDPTYWSASENPLTADSRGDNILGLYQAWEDVAVWGQTSREIWQSTDGTPPYAPRTGALCEAGLLAPYSVRKADNTFFALCVVDDKPAVVRLAGNDPVIISLDIERILDGMTTLSDAIGDITSAGGQSFYILTFPSEGQSWAYNIKKQEWYRWSLWNLDAARRDAFLGRNFIYAKAWGKHLCQSRLNGKIYEVDFNEATDPVVGEMVENGVEWTGTGASAAPDGWTGYNTPVFSLTADKWLCMSNSSTNAFITQAVSTVSGEKYVAFVDGYYAGGVMLAYLYVGTSAGSSTLGLSYVGGTSTYRAKASIKFTATSSTTYITLRISGASTGFSYWKNASMRPVLELPYDGTIRTEWVTDWEDFGTSLRKIMQSIRFHLKRGHGALNETEPVLTFKYRDDGKEAWTPERQIPLGTEGQHNFYRRLNSLGTFRARQMSLVLTDAVKLVLRHLDIDVRKLRT